MARLFIHGEWYDGVAPSSMYEVHFETILAEHAQVLFPGYKFVEFRKTLKSDHGDVRADFALVDEEYRGWWLVEVEVATHSLKGHVEPQVARLATAHVGDEEALYLAKKDMRLDLRQLREMMLGPPPKVLVLVNESSPTWRGALSSWGALVGVVEVFRSSLNRIVLRINGEQPPPFTAESTSCFVDPFLPMTLVIERPGLLGGAPGSEFRIEYGGTVSRWRRVDAKGRVWIMPLERYPLPEDVRRFDLQKTATGAFAIFARREMRT